MVLPTLVNAEHFEVEVETNISIEETTATTDEAEPTDEN
jgi:hypothetical protein